MSNMPPHTRSFPFGAAVFCALFLLAPLPLLIFDGFVPLVRFFLLAGVSVTVAMAEGAGGPVAMITGFLIAHAVAYTVLLIVLARLARRLLQRLPQRFAVALLAACLAVGIGLAVLTELYVTPFGPQPHANLLGILS